MKKIFVLMGLVLSTRPIFADSITDAMSMAGDEVYSYTPVVQVLCLIIVCIIGIVGAFSIYSSIANHEPGIQKKILRWGTGSLAMVCMTLALPKFFNYQEGAGGAGGSTDGGLTDLSGWHRGNGGTTIPGGTIITVIPDLSDSRWTLDPTYFRPIGGGTTPIINPRPIIR